MYPPRGSPFRDLCAPTGDQCGARGGLRSSSRVLVGFGRNVGDRALCEVAKVFRAAIRPYDICVRYGGGEFIFVLSGCGPEEAAHKRLELLEAVETLYFESERGLRVPLSIRAGVATFPHDGTSFEDLLTVADRRQVASGAGQDSGGIGSSEAPSAE